MENKKIKLNKKSQVEIIAVLLFIVLITSTLILVWNFYKPILESPDEEISCIYLINALTINNACYLNENEIAVTINKKSGEPTNKLRFTFTGLDTAIWELTGEKCLDARLSDNIYGHYCKLPLQGETLTYVFNVTGTETKSKITLQAGNKLCFIGEKDIKGSC